jgi:hypothetical protein
MVYVQENQSVSITITLNHINAAVIWKRQVTHWITTPDSLMYSYTLSE